MQNFSHLDPIYLLKNVYFTPKFIFFAAVIVLVLSYFLTLLKKFLSKRTGSRRQQSNVNLFIRLIKYAIFLSLILGVSIHYSTSFKDLSLVLGALTAALGFALQKPISAVAAWLMLVIKRPFDIGDRIIIDGVKGNVIDISITHIHIEEVGRYGGEETSGRSIIIPNSILFEKNITNYSHTSDYILGQVIVTVSYESNVDKAVAITNDAAKKYTEEYSKVVGKDSHTRLYFSNNGMEIHIRYYVPFDKAQEVATDITREIYDQIRQSSDIEISYTHTKVILDNKNI